jgi:hypothetical protein
MQITIEPTEEKYLAPVNGVQVPTRIWLGVTEGGINIEAYVLSIVPLNEFDAADFKAECQADECLKPSRELYAIDTRSEQEKRAQSIHETGMEN